MLKGILGFFGFFMRGMFYVECVISLCLITQLLRQRSGEDRLWQIILRVSSLTVSPAGVHSRVTDEVIRFVVFRSEPDYVLWLQFIYG
jgi:hypothetical protein